MKHILVIFGFVAIVGFLHLNFITTMGDNVMNMQTKEKSMIQFLFPQGWGFFTRDPRELKYKLYRTDSGVPQLVNFRITSSENAFGFSRIGSRIGMELERVKGLLPSVEDWDTSTIPIGAMPLDRVVYSCAKPIAKEKLLYIQEGHYMLIAYELSPWSWAKYQGRYSKTFKYFPFQLTKS